MPTVTFEMPDDVVAALHTSPEAIPRELRLAAAIHWYHRAELSMAMAAKLAGMDRVTFLDTLAGRGIDSVVVDIEDLKRELQRG